MIGKNSIAGYWKCKLFHLQVFSDPMPKQLGFRMAVSRTKIRTSKPKRWHHRAFLSGTRLLICTTPSALLRNRSTSPPSAERVPSGSTTMAVPETMP